MILLEIKDEIGIFFSFTFMYIGIFGYFPMASNRAVGPGNGI